jgi:hypothetical protein
MSLVPFPPHPIAAMFSFSPTFCARRIAGAALTAAAAATLRPMKTRRVKRLDMVSLLERWMNERRRIANYGLRPTRARQKPSTCGVRPGQANDALGITAGRKEFNEFP